jgi:hypothetical protein
MDPAWSKTAPNTEPPHEQPQEEGDNRRKTGHQEKDGGAPPDVQANHSREIPCAWSQQFRKSDDG